LIFDLLTGLLIEYIMRLITRVGWITRAWVEAKNMILEYMDCKALSKECY